MERLKLKLVPEMLYLEKMRKVFFSVLTKPQRFSHTSMCLAKISGLVKIACDQTFGSEDSFWFAPVLNLGEIANLKH